MNRAGLEMWAAAHQATAEDPSALLDACAGCAAELEDFAASCSKVGGDLLVCPGIGMSYIYIYVIHV